MYKGKINYYLSYYLSNYYLSFLGLSIHIHVYLY